MFLRENAGRLISFLIALALPAAALAQPAVPNSWTEFQSDEGALVAYGKGGFDVLAVKDAAGKILDYTEGAGGVPYLAQYRLNPGTYNAILPDESLVSFDVVPGGVAYLDLSSKIYGVAYEPPESFADVVAEYLSNASSLPDPADIAPVTNALYFGRNTESPYPNPFLPEPKPPGKLEN